MRREPALHDARLDAMAKKFAGREQSGRTGPHDQDGRCGCGRAILTGMQQPDISSADGSFVRFEGRVVAAAGVLQWGGPPVSVPVPGVVQIARRRRLTDWSAWRATASSAPKKFWPAT